jgi:hypothetical protein
VATTAQAATPMITHVTVEIVDSLVVCAKFLASVART